MEKQDRKIATLSFLSLLYQCHVWKPSGPGLSLAPCCECSCSLKSIVRAIITFT